MKILFTLIIIVAVLSAECNALSKYRFNTLLNLVKQWLSLNEEHIPTAVRLGFHDCVGKSCDGCINLNNPSNNGLDRVIAGLHDLYKRNNCGNYVSFADFIQISVIGSIELGIRNNNRKCKTGADDDCKVPTKHGITFEYGRTDCATPPYTTEVFQFPASTMNYTELMEYFNKMFGFNPMEVTALMGAHTLGRAKKANSGYSGSWVKGGENDWNNEYYRLLVDSSNNFKNIPNACEVRKNKKWQWNITHPVKQVQDGIDSPSREELGFMLNTDAVLYKRIDVNKEFGTFCNYFGGCDNSDTFKTVKNYARSYKRWMGNFVKVYKKMAAHGNKNLRDLQ